MSKPTAEQRVLERIDALVAELQRLSPAIEQLAAQMARSSFRVETTGPGVTGLRHFNTAAQQPEPTKRRPRQANTGK